MGDMTKRLFKDDLKHHLKKRPTFAQMWRDIVARTTGVDRHPEPDQPHTYAPDNEDELFQIRAAAEEAKTKDIHVSQHVFDELYEHLKAN